MSVASTSLKSTYSPRAAWFEDVVDCGPLKIKLNIIQANSAHPVSAALIDKVREKIGSVSLRIPAEHRDAGFAVLHQGEEAVWLLLHWWLDGGITTRILWRAPLNGAVNFIDADPLLMACVWELSVIDFERRAWMKTAMAGQPVSSYLTNKLPRGTV